MMLSMPIIVTFAVALTMSLMLALAFSGPSVGKSKDRRLAILRERHSATAEAAVMAQMRKAISSRMNNGAGRGNMPRRDQLALRLRKTGKSWTINQLGVAVLVLFVVFTGLLLLIRAPALLAMLVGALMALAIPYVVTGFLIGKRVNQFTSKFPDAIDLLVRGLRSGLPVTETLQVVSSEVPGPVGIEFRQIVERIRIGKTMEVALQETADLLGTAEFQFFVITLAIQRETGGNLAETLSNLSEVLRKRAQMKLKIKAMSSEAKASAYIVGCLPFFVFGAVWMINQEYLIGFFTEDRLIITGIGGLVWMGIGVAIMAKMIRFEI